MSDLSKTISRFSDVKLVVLGDLVVDEYIHGTTRRISREAPVLIVREDNHEVRLGGAGNVVANICAMGGKAIPVGLLGADDNGNELLELLESAGVPAEGLVVDPGRFTTTKTRVLAGGRNTVKQQMLRIDRLNKGSVEASIRSTLMDRLNRLVEGASALVVSDYGLGVVGEELVAAVLKIAQDGDVPVFADARLGIERFKGAEALTPNEPELATSAGMDVHRKSGLEKAGRWLLKETGSKSVLVKRGNDGMALFLPEEPMQLVPVFGLAEVADVTGAGDTVLAAFSLARAAGASPADAMRIANTAGGIKVTKAGTAVVEARELKRALREPA